MSVELLKLLVQPIVLERDDAGRIVGERLGEVTPLYSLDDLARFREAAELELERANNGANGAPQLKGEAMSETTSPEPTTPEPAPEPGEPEPGDGDNGDGGEDE